MCGKEEVEAFLPWPFPWGTFQGKEALETIYLIANPEANDKPSSWTMHRKYSSDLYLPSNLIMHIGIKVTILDFYSFY